MTNHSDFASRAADILRVADDMIANPSWDIMPSCRTTMKAMTDLIRSAITEKRTCRWEYDEDHDKWNTGCGGAWQFMDGGPKENNVGFCPYNDCGLPIEIVKGKE